MKNAGDQEVKGGNGSAMDVDIPKDEAVASTNKSSGISLADIFGNIVYISRGIELNQPRLLGRAIRQNVSIRKYVQKPQLRQLAQKYFPGDFPSLPNIFTFIEKLPDTPEPTEGVEEKKQENDAMDIATDAPPAIQQAELIFMPVMSILPEVEVYLFTLVVTTLMRYNLNEDAVLASSFLLERIRTFNRRSLDQFSSKAFFYYSLAHEKVNRLDTIRPTLLAFYRTSCVRRDEMGQAVLLNLLLRNYLEYNLVEAAHTLSMRANFPENASNNQFCRYLYYMGRIQAIQLDYSEAYQRLLMAARKAPPGTAGGFSRDVHKLIVIVQLLMGDIPERAIFNQVDLRQALQPYLALTLAVRNGDLKMFNAVTAEHAAAFTADGTITLVQRLGHNVLKTGLRKISVSYSRVSLQDIANKLHLPSAAAAEYICAKAIRDGVIEAKIDHENGWLSSHEVLDLYTTDEPQRAFHKRIAFCLDVHNEAVKSMRYPSEEAYKAELAAKNGKKSGDKDKDSDKTIEEIIKELEDEYDEP
jgi:26S proteasome regulatory subunit N3